MKRLVMLFSQASAVLKAYKVRTIISIIGVLLGAMSLVIVQNVSLSLNKKIYEDIKAMGDRVITVFARVPYTPGKMSHRQRVTSMKSSDAALLLNIKNVVGTAPAVRASGNIKYKNSTVASVVMGTTEEYLNMRGFKVLYGRIFDDYERQEREKVAIIGQDILKDIFNGRDPLGETIMIGSNTFEVIGVLEEKGADANGNSIDNIVVIPVETILVKILNRDYINQISVQLSSWEDFEVVKGDIAHVLRIAHRLSPTAPDDFDTINPIDEQEMSNTLVKLASLLGRISAGVSFFIGTVGIFSLMLLIVEQRKTEIGIRRAIGSTKRDILLQFLLESGYVGMLGGVTGVIAGTAISLLISNIAKLPYSISGFGLFIAFFAALSSGVIAGLYPAMKASRVVPVKALRL